MSINPASSTLPVASRHTISDLAIHKGAHQTYDFIRTKRETKVHEAQKSNLNSDSTKTLGRYLNTTA